MSKSDPPQVQTDALTSEDSENIADLAAEESINDPVSSIVLLYFIAHKSRNFGPFGTNIFTIRLIRWSMIGWQCLKIFALFVYLRSVG